jgi:hypothetical protein
MENNKSVTEFAQPEMTPEQFQSWVNSYDGVSSVPENVQEYAFDQLNQLLVKLRTVNQNLGRML